MLTRRKRLSDVDLDQEKIVEVTAIVSSYCMILAFAVPNVRKKINRTATGVSFQVRRRALWAGVASWFVLASLSLFFSFMFQLFMIER